MESLGPCALSNLKQPMERSGTEWNGVEWSGVEWRGV